MNALKSFRYRVYISSILDIGRSEAYFIEAKRLFGEFAVK